MKKTTRAIHQAYKRRDAYDALSMPVYNTVAYEFDNAQTMSDVFCGRIAAPDYSRVGNPTVENFEPPHSNVSVWKHAFATSPSLPRWNLCSTTTPAACT